MSRIDLKKTTITIAGTGGSVTASIAEGNLEYRERKNREYHLDRGLLDTVRDGDEEPLELNFTFVWDFLRSETGGTVTIEDALKGTGGASGWTSTGSDPCEPYCVTVTVDYEPDCGTVPGESIVFSEFRYEELQHNFRDGTVSCSGRCKNTSPTLTRS